MRINKRSLSVGLMLAEATLTYVPSNATAQSIFHVAPIPNDNPNNGLFAVSASSPSDTLGERKLRPYDPHAAGRGYHSPKKNVVQEVAGLAIGAGCNTPRAAVPMQ